MYSQLFFWIHAVASAIAAVLIIALAVQCRLHKLKWHKRTAIAMAAFGITGLIASLVNGIYLEFDLSYLSDLSASGIHNFAGFASLVLSLVPFAIIKLRGRKFLPQHFAWGYAAAAFAVIALVTGLIAYSPYIISGISSGLSLVLPFGSPLILASPIPTPTLSAPSATSIIATVSTVASPSPEPGFSPEPSSNPSFNPSPAISPSLSSIPSPSPSPAPTQNCISREALRAATDCWVAVDGVVYDMTAMKKWSRAGHFDCSCNSEYSLNQLPHGHASSNHYGPVVGALCP